MEKTTIKLLASMYGREGEKVALFYNGKLIKRRVYYRTWCGLYIIINNRLYFAYELPVGEEITFEAGEMTQEESQEISEAQENMVEAIKSICAPKATESKSETVKRLCGAPRLIEDHESIKDLARMYHIEECYDKASDSIRFDDDYFNAIDIFVIDLLKNEHDFRLRCDADRVWHLERV